MDYAELTIQDLLKVAIGEGYSFQLAMNTVLLMHDEYHLPPTHLEESLRRRADEIQQYLTEHGWDQYPFDE